MKLFSIKLCQKKKSNFRLTKRSDDNYFLDVKVQSSNPAPSGPHPYMCFTRLYHHLFC